MVVHNFMHKKHKISKNSLNRVMIEIMMNKIDPWYVTASPELDFYNKYIN
jgi:hypothetical protein